ncbi:hypothetical protein RN22_08100 [Grimontia sp. AD028]|uniref:ShlB/FhaC/HecB family hemolysin secretion/activation protein n=1 Tax=Grimontia sp. AD028 TaxID=1581149 RepID=UPI00061AB8E5|nr:ShlB/FhaC/HecB family hemolysin secretion/activation protein [Grimontia sp. AD028]KKD60996.1 hypothetical protein RN22_08100 [Grimontia sp. AD028]
MFTRVKIQCLLLPFLSFSHIESAWSVQDIGRALESKDKEKYLRELPNSLEVESKSNKRNNISVDSKDYKFHVEGIFVDGSSGLIEKVGAVEYFGGFKGASYTFNELQKIVDDINSKLFEEGYVTSKFYFPPQDVTEGNVVVKFIEGVIDKPGTLELNSSFLGNDDESYIYDFIEKNLNDGDVLDNDDIERNLLLLSDLPSFSVSGNLKPGKYENSTRIELDISKDDTLNLVTSVDNYGSRYTGEYRYIAGLTWNNPTSIKDRLSFSLLKSGGMGDQIYGQVNYQNYIGYSGLNLKLSQSWMESEFGGVFEPLDSVSKASVSNISIFYPVIKTRSKSLDVFVSYDKKNLKDELLGIKTNHREIDRGAIGANFHFNDELIIGAYNIGKISYYNGYLDLSKVYGSYESDQALGGAKTHGSFEKLTYFIRRIQNLGMNITAIFDLDGQEAFNNLNSAEKYALGGVYGVRAYPDGELSGDNALRMALDIKYRLPTSLFNSDYYLSTFYDWGVVDRYYDSDNIPTDRKNKVSIQGAGLGLEISSKENFRFSLMLAKQLKRDYEYFNEYNSDGTKDRERLLASFSYEF